MHRLNSYYEELSSLSKEELVSICIASTHIDNILAHDSKHLIYGIQGIASRLSKDTRIPRDLIPDMQDLMHNSNILDDFLNDTYNIQYVLNGRSLRPTKLRLTDFYRLIDDWTAHEAKAVSIQGSPNDNGDVTIEVDIKSISVAIRSLIRHCNVVRTREFPTTIGPIECIADIVMVPIIYEGIGFEGLDCLHCFEFGYTPNVLQYISPRLSIDLPLAHKAISLSGGTLNYHNQLDGNCNRSIFEIRFQRMSNSELDS